MKRIYNPNKCKIHCSYTVEEVTDLYNVHKRTVRNWIKSGLPICDGNRPLLILGTDLKLFLSEKRKANKSKCKSSELFCFRCRTPQKPETKTVNFFQKPSGTGLVFGLCNVCKTKMYKSFSWRRLDVIKSEFMQESTVSTITHSYEGSTPPRLHLGEGLR